EPALASSRRAVHRDPLAPEPAFALGWRVPDPVGNLDAFLPFVLQAGLLADGEASRLHRRLVLQDRLVTSIGAYLGVFGDPLDGRDPIAFQVRAFHPSDIPIDRALAALDEE